MFGNISSINSLSNPTYSFKEKKKDKIDDFDIVGRLFAYTGVIPTSISQKKIEILPPNSPYTITQIDMGSSRIIYKIEGTDLVLKVPKSSVPVDRMYNEYFSYIASQKLNLHVVPFGALVHAQGIDNTFVFQKYPGLEEMLRYRFRDTILFLQQFLPNKITIESKLTLENGHALLFFNLIVGRDDASMVNSMIDEHGNMFDIDNEIIGLPAHGNSLNGHWLTKRPEIWNTPISQELIHTVLEFKGSLGIKHEEISKEIEDNLAKIQKAILTVQGNCEEGTFENILRHI